MGPLRGFREQGNKGIYFRGTGEKACILGGLGEGARTQRQFWGTWNTGYDDFDFGQKGNKSIELEHDKTNKITAAHGEDADLPRHPPSLISLRCALNE